MNLIRTERHIVANDKYIDNLCFLSKNLYNYVNYLIRQEFIQMGSLPKMNELLHRLAKENQTDYRALPAPTSQQIIRVLYRNWWNFFAANKSYKTNPNKFNGRPKLPGYKDKVKGRNLVIFTNQQCRLRGGYILFPEVLKLKNLKTLVSSLQQVRIIPQSSCYIIEIVYKKEREKYYELNKENYLGIDLGVNNLAALVTNQELAPLLVNGRIIKSMNQYYNKRKAKLQSKLKKNQFISKRIQRLTLKRNNKICDYLHKTSKFIINYCIKNNIGNIVIGKNNDWKQNINLGRINNQKFVNIPFNKLIYMIQYKAEESGISVIIQEESYTSKCDALALEFIEKHENYLGSRIKRGLFQSSVNKLINADVNGALNILRKVIGDNFIKNLTNRGFVNNPVRINILTNTPLFDVNS
jgi:putative transposase